MLLSRIAFALGIAGMVATLGCFTGAPPFVPGPDFEQFRTEIYPLLLRDCGFNACHGNEDRYYQVFGPGRMRIDEEMDLFLPPTEEEIEVSYERARAMLLTRDDVLDSPLLRKPVEGGGHAGLDGQGRNVYAGRNDPEFLVLLEWARGAVEGS
jgi:hypothetical protein